MFVEILQSNIYDVSQHIEESTQSIFCKQDDLSKSCGVGNIF